MDRLLQQFEQPVTYRDGEIYDVFLYGRSRPSDTWQGWLVFQRRSDAERFMTGVETTQPNEEAILYWGTGLTNAYLEGALIRAMRPRRETIAAQPLPAPLIDEWTDDATRAERLRDIERTILAYFRRQHIDRVPTQLLLEDLPHSHADVIRAIEDLAQRDRVLQRRTEQGTDWLFLTAEGVRITRSTSRHDERANL